MSAQWRIDECADVNGNVRIWEGDRVVATDTVENAVRRVREHNGGMSAHTATPWEVRRCVVAGGYSWHIMGRHPDGHAANIGEFSSPQNAEWVCSCANALDGLNPAAIPAVGRALEQVLDKITRSSDPYLKGEMELDRANLYSALAALRGEGEAS